MRDLHRFDMSHTFCSFEMFTARIVINLAFSLTANAPHIIVKVRFEKHVSLFWG